MRSFRAAVWTLAATLAIPAAARAGEPRFRFGALGGAAWSDLAITDDEAAFTRLSIVRPDLGLSAEMRLGGPLSLDLRGVWAEKGTRILFFKDSGVEPELRLRYVAFPILLKVTGSRFGVRPYLMAGPELAFRHSAQAMLREGGTRQEEDIEEQTRATDVAARFGAGMEVPRGRASFLLEASYSLGLRNVFKAEDLEPGDEDYTVKTRSFSVNAGIRF
jgi:hypothetical protein